MVAKTEFRKFGGIIDKVSRKLQETQNVPGIDVEVGVAAGHHGDWKVSRCCQQIEGVTILELDSPEEPADRNPSVTQPNRTFDVT